MPSLSTALRTKLKNTTLEARELAEKACEAALQNLAVHEKEYRSHMDEGLRQLRNRLRARGRSLGDRLGKDKTQGLTFLTQDAAYEHWHRLLFTRFLTENGLLLSDEETGSVPVDLADCEEMAAERGARDGFDLACRFASSILPGVFRQDDPILELPIARDQAIKLRALVESIPAAVFQSDDALGWTYQFWQEKQKKAINDGGDKIGAAQLPAVTQLFTEDYMVEFLLHNTLGAWWAGKQGPVTADSEEAARRAYGLPEREGLPGIAWSYLRLVRDEEIGTWSPAGSTFTGWPHEVSALRVLDPSMGSGHLLTFALPLLARLQMEEGGLSQEDAVQAVLRDNLHGLELDPRCCQIGAFNLALTAWKLQGQVTPLPSLQIACCGLAISGSKTEWQELVAGKTQSFLMGQLHDLFAKAPELGSLIDPKRQLKGFDFPEKLKSLLPALEKSLQSHRSQGHFEESETSVTAKGLASAYRLLRGSYHLVSTNVPYLARGKQGDILRDHIESYYSKGKTDLATAFVERSIAFCALGGTTALVTPQNWLFLGSYKQLRKNLLENDSFDWIARLGPRAFETISGEVVNATLISITKNAPNDDIVYWGLDVSEASNAKNKATELLKREKKTVPQLSQLKNPDWRIGFESPRSSQFQLQDLCECYQGLRTGDRPRFVLFWWETMANNSSWEPFRSSTSSTNKWDGVLEALRWESGEGSLHRYAKETRERLHDMHESGQRAWGRRGVSVNLMGDLAAYHFGGEKFDGNANVIYPTDEGHLTALWSFCESKQHSVEVRKIDQKLAVTNATLLKVPFDLEHWQKIADEKYPDGLPEPYSNDPTQWLFKGRIDDTTPEHVLHVAVARLMNYRWPAELDADKAGVKILPEDEAHWKLCTPHVDEDGIVCLSALNKEATCAERIRRLLQDTIPGYDEAALIAATGSKKRNLEDWLRDDFFKDHCKTFQKRPFIWHIWDGEKNGFHALLNYHQLDQANLKTLIYSYLGDWIRDCQGNADADKPGAAELLGAAQALQQKLEAVLEGEAPLDIFVRWKPLAEQANGWQPDLNDGVRLNIRPFILAGDVGTAGAGILRTKPGIAWKPNPKNPFTPDRGKEPLREKVDYPWFWCEEDPGTDPTGGDTFTGKRWNTTHLTNAKKLTAREKQ